VENEKKAKVTNKPLLEIAEELSVVIIPNTAIHIGNFSAKSDGTKEGIKVLMTCYKAKYTGHFKACS
jgi:hypothetical protein